MKKIFTALLVFILTQVSFTHALYAQERTGNPAQRETYVPPTEALNVGYTFMRTGTGTRGTGTRSNDVRKQAMQLIYTGKAVDSTTRAVTDCYYVFALQPKGFVIVAADNRVQPILGYSYDNNFVVENMPAHVRGWLGNYEKQIEAVVKNNIEPEAEIVTKWSRLKAGHTMSTRSGESVGPLLTTTWDQGQYYNAMCPEDADGPDGRVYTGCVATAMAQIINYLGYPVHGRGSHSYNLSGLDPGSMGYQINDYSTLSVNFDSATYDYNHMPDALSSESAQEEIDAVAQLMYHCGVGVNMEYGPSASGAREEDVRSALISYFGFAHTLGYAQRQLYTDEEWADSLRANIDRNEPVFYCGKSAFGAHAFVLDGYNEDDYFHFNFGWSGDCDGWFLTTAINVGFGFNEWQSAIMGIRPSNEEHAAICHRIMYVQNNDYFTVTEPIDLFPMRGGSVYKAANEMNGVRINLNLVPEDESGQLVLDVLEFDNEQSVVIYDGINKDSVVRVIETRNLDDWNTVTYHTWSYEGGLSDTIFQNMASTDFLPIVSTKHGFTAVVYSYGGVPGSFHLRVSDAANCRMVSNLTAIQDNGGIYVSWDENGNATQWEVKVGATSHVCDSTHILLTGLSSDSSYNVQVRAICDEQHNSSWNTIVVNKKVYWTDVVKSEPEGYVIDGDTIRITTPEGLAWLAHCIDSIWINGINYFFYAYKDISIENDLNLDGYYWEPIRLWGGNVKGNGHVISNMKVNTSSKNGGLFSSFGNSVITDLGMINARVNAVHEAGSIAGVISGCIMKNCYSVGHIINTQNSQGGGLIGLARDSQIDNCYAYGDIYAQFGYGGLVGYSDNSDIHNSVTQLGKAFNWGSLTTEWRGLLTEEVHGGNFSNCFSDISNAKWYNTNPETYRYYFLGNIYNVDAIENLATFNISLDEMGMLFADTAVNYTLGENMDVVTALNNMVAEYNLPVLRTWVRDEVTHMPILGDYYEVTCPNVSDITADNIAYNDGFAVVLSWQENGDAEEWQVKYKMQNAPDSTATVYNTSMTNDTIEGLQLGNMYEFYVRPICGESPTVGWGQPIAFFVDKALWVDVVTECPEGYLEDSDGNVTISSPEGLAWLAKIGFNYRNDRISIANDLDMGAYKWTPIGRESFAGTVEGNNHVISNIYCSDDLTNIYSTGIGLIAHAQNATLNNIVIQNSSFTGNRFVGSLVGYMENGTINNCHAFNVIVKGIEEVGGLGGCFPSCETRNCSSSGYVYADFYEGGLIGNCNGVVSNCYSNCYVRPMGDRYRLFYGGLFGGAVGIVYNCYSSGDVEAGTNDTWDKPGGRLVGNTLFTGDHLYARNNSELPFIERVEEGVLISDTASFNNDGVLNNSVTIADSTFTNLLDALNAWVDANDMAGIYRRWAADSANVNGGFPVFAAIPCITVTSSDSIVVCDSYTWHGEVYTTSTTLVDSLLTPTGCDSIVTHYLIVNQSTTGIDEQTACESYTWIDGVTYTASTNEPTFTLNNAAACDSVVTLHLTITNTDHTDFTDVACDSYTWNGETYTQSGAYSQTFTNQAGCDSVVTLHLTVNNSTTGIDEQTACESFTWINGVTYTESTNTPTFTLTNAAGCDSIVTLHLTINNPVHTAVTEVACESFTWNGTDYTVSGDYTYSHADNNGCMQVDTLHLTITNTDHTDFTDVACDSYMWNGETYTESGTYTQTFTNSAGCDSVVTLYLTINNATTGIDEQTACESFTWINGVTYTESTNTPTFTLTNAAGCDSIVTLHLTINSAYHEYLNVSACEEYVWNGETYLASGDYNQTFTAANGCDSIVTLHLTINSAYHENLHVSACEEYVWNGETYSASGDYNQTFTAANGCDSIVTLHLTINSAYHEYLHVSACEEYVWNGETYLASGDYNQTFTAANGCDSIVTLHLTINNPVHTAVTEVACESFTWNGTDYTVSGDYTYSHADNNGCMQVDTLHLTIYSSATSEFTIVTEDPCYSWNNVEYCETGDYIQTLQTVHGCDSVVTLHLTITVGVNDYDGFDFKVYPNPTSNIVNVECTMKNEDWGEMELHLCDAYGRLLDVVGANNHSPLRTARIDLSRYASGVYFVKAVADGKTIAVRKVVKQ